MDFSTTSLAPSVVSGFALSLVLLIVILAYSSRPASTRRYPPGPPGWPLIGTLSLPKTKAWVTYRAWSDKYSSDVIGLKLPGLRITILNSFQAATDLVDKRSALYADRPRSGLTMLIDLCGFGWPTNILPYGPAWREGRTIYQHELHPTVIPKYRPGALMETRKLVVRLFERPDEFMAHLRLLIGAQILRFTYGIDVNDSEDPYITLVERAMHTAKRTAIPGSYLVDILPILRYLPEWFPGASFKRTARLWQKDVLDSRDKPFNLVQEKMATNPNAVAESITKSMIQDINSGDKEDPAFAEYVARSVAGTVYLAGSDTTYSSLTSFFLAMVIYPDVQRRAQAAVDEVCAGRLPDFSDYHSIPFVDALMKETLRWNPIVPLGLPYRCMQDNAYRGYFIPEGTMIVANIWAMCYDEEVYPDPETFNPDRFLMSDGSSKSKLVLNPDVRDPSDIVFGFGRRICPGSDMARETMWIAIASVLAAFDIVPVKDANGKDLVPPFENEPGFIIDVKPFKCVIRPRSATHEALIRETKAEI